MSNLGDPDLINQLNNLADELPLAIRKMADCGRDYAIADQRYRTEKAKEIARLRDAGQPATLIGELVYNNETVSQALHDRDETESLRDAAKENVHAIKVRIRVLEDQLKMEWANE